ncbi:hypothetical protein RCH07_001035 [Arthrobacter sp. CG_A4]|nr:hypothetical protein [Arthrobacter sp. CG_A4]
MGTQALSPKHVRRGPFFWPRWFLLLILLAIIAAWAPLVASADWSAAGAHAAEKV